MGQAADTRRVIMAFLPPFALGNGLGRPLPGGQPRGARRLARRRSLNLGPQAAALEQAVDGVGGLGPVGHPLGQGLGLHRHAGRVLVGIVDSDDFQEGPVAGGLGIGGHDADTDMDAVIQAVADNITQLSR